MKKKKLKEWNYVSYLKSAIRRIWRWSKQRRECLKTDKCAQCKSKSKVLFADHIHPVVDTKTGFKDWNTYIDRMFNGDLQPLCEQCHKAKSNKENQERKIARAKNKKKQN